MTKLADFKPQQRNANKGKPIGLTQLDKSIRRDGYSAPMVAAADGEVFAGSKRLERSADVFGLDVEPIVVHSDGTRPVIHVRDDIPTADDPRAVRLGVADNVIAHEDYDPDGAILAELAAQDAAIMEMVKCDDLSVEAIEALDRDGSADAEPQIDRAAELNEKWQVKTGSLWRIGEHRLLCGDSTKLEDLKKISNDTCSDLLILDPPYGIEWEGSNASTIEWEAIEGDKDTDTVSKVIPLIGEQPAILWGANCFPSLLPHRGRWLCWDKRVNEDADRMLGSPFELAWMNKTSGFDMIIRVQHGGALNADGGDRLHPTQKPVELYKRAIEWAYKDVSSVDDWFAGSGTTLVACQNLQRKCRAIEISPNYCAVILQRMQDAFPQIEIERLS